VADVAKARINNDFVAAHSVSGIGFPNRVPTFFAAKITDGPI